MPSIISQPMSMSRSLARSRYPGSSSSTSFLGGYGGAFLLVNALSSKLYDLINDSQTTIVRAYEQGGGLAGLLRSTAFRALLRRYLWLVSIGLAIERLSKVWKFVLQLVPSVSNYFFVDALVKPGDQAYEWLLALWSSTPAFKARSRDFVVETTPRTLKGKRAALRAQQAESIYSGIPMLPGKEEDDIVTRLSPKDTAEQWIWHNGTLFRFRRWQLATTTTCDYNGQAADAYSLLSVRAYSLTRRPLFSLLKKARDVYEQTQPQMITIRVLDARGSWRRVAYRHRRPLSSIIMDEETRETLLSDVKEFLQSESWYSQRGIPWKRGVLLHGVPGSGKSSTIQAIASEVKLDVYVISVNSPSMSDSLLQSAMRSIPPRSILVMEDVDVSFQAQKRDDVQQGTTRVTSSRRSMMDLNNSMYYPPPAAPISLSSMLNAIDGVEANEGRILFCTTNSIASLDAALVRPGRMDLIIEYKRATTQQAERLFNVFYAPAGTNEMSDEEDVISVQLASPKGKRHKSEAAKEKSEKGVVGKKQIPKHPFELPPDITAEQLTAWAKEWAAHVEDEVFSIAELQGMLLKYKKDPQAAVATMPAWVKNELKNRAEAEKRKAEQAEAKLKPEEEEKLKLAAKTADEVVKPRKSKASVSMADVADLKFTSDTPSAGEPKVASDTQPDTGTQAIAEEKAAGASQVDEKGQAGAESQAASDSQPDHASETVVELQGPSRSPEGQDSLSINATQTTTPVANIA